MTSLIELLRLSHGLTSLQIERWVARGLLRPSGDADAWSFEQVDIARVHLLAELTEQIGFEGDTLETVVGLIDQVNTLRDRLDLLAQAIAEQPEAAREAIGAALARLAVRRP